MLRITSRRIVVLAALLAGLIVPPAMIRAAGFAQGTPSIAHLPAVFKAEGPPGTTSGTLTDGGTFTGVDGLTIGAMPGTLTQTIEVTIASMNAPQEALPMNTQLVLGHYQVSSDLDLVPPLDKPFILGIPVPGGGLTQTLAVAMLVPTADFLDTDPGQSHQWLLSPGVYDPATAMFMTTLSTLPDSGFGVALVENPAMDSTLAGPARALSSGTTPGFFAACIGFASPADCGPAQQDAIEAAADQALIDYNDDFFGMGFKLPKLLGMSAGTSLSPPQAKQPFDTFFVYIYANGTEGCTPGVLGYYSPSTGLLVVCHSPGAPITDVQRSVLRHEYFHAIQYAYDSIYDPLWLGTAVPENFIIEGTATAAEESLFTMKRASVIPFSLHPVDVPLTEESSNAVFQLAGEQYEYKAQDFWVFLGEKNGWWLDYLIGLFERGAWVEDVVQEFGDGEYLEPYWDWAKNQVMEKTIDFGGALGTACELEAQLVLEPELFEFKWDTHALHPVTVGPLDTIVVEVVFDLEYDFAFGWVYVTDPNQNPDAQQALRYKFFEEAEAGCEGIPDGPRTYLDVKPEPKRYYVVISNIDYDKTNNYTIQFEVAPIPIP